MALLCRCFQLWVTILAIIILLTILYIALFPWRVFPFLLKRITMTQCNNATEADRSPNRSLPKKKFAVISVATPHANKTECARGSVHQCYYVFYLPLTALAWRRIGYSTAIMIVGDDVPWLQDGTYLNFIYKTLLSIGTVNVIFIKAQEDLKVGLAQNSRLLAADIEPFSLDPDTYLVTGDADLFPIKNIYDLESPENDVRLTNPFQGIFLHGSEKIQMVALASVGMRVSTWNAVMNYRRFSNHTNPFNRIVAVLNSTFGYLPYNLTHGGEEWFFDQKLISINLEKWFNSTDVKRSCIRRSEFHGRIVRFDRADWPNSLKNARTWLNGTDAHLLIPGHSWKNFKRLEPLAQLLAGDSFNVTAYREQYINILGAGDDKTDTTINQNNLSLLLTESVLLLFLILSLAVAVFRKNYRK